MADTADVIGALVSTLVELPLRLERLEAQQREILARLQRRDEDAQWTTRADLARQIHVSVDTIDRRAAAEDGIEIRRVGRRVLVRLRERAPDDEITSKARAS